MITSKIQLRARNRYYWFAWLAVLCAFVVARFVVLPEIAEKSHLNLGDWYMLGVWFPIMLLNLYEGRRLMSYLRQHHPAKWAELTTFGGFGPGYVNGFRSVPWLFSAETLNDPTLGRLKADYRHFIYWVLTVFFSFPIFVIAFRI
jgi:hypothetical protein